jgi:hypothetical protein
MLCKSSAEAIHECASSLEHRFKTGVDFFLFDKLAALGCRYSFFHGARNRASSSR